MRKISVFIPEELFDWIKDYQYTFQLKFDQDKDLYEIVAEALEKFRKDSNVDIQPRPEYLRAQEMRRARKISEGLLKTKKS